MFDETGMRPIDRVVDPPVPVYVRTERYGHPDVGVPGLLVGWVGLVEWGSRVWRAQVTVDPDDVPDDVRTPPPSVGLRDVVPYDPLTGEPLRR